MYAFLLCQDLLPYCLLYDMCAYWCDCAQAAAQLGVQPRPAWLLQFYAASQPKLQHMTAAELAAVAEAVASLGSPPQDSWYKQWEGCSTQQLADQGLGGRAVGQLAVAAVTLGTKLSSSWVQQLIATAQNLAVAKQSTASVSSPNHADVTADTTATAPSDRATTVTTATTAASASGSDSPQSQAVAGLMLDATAAADIVWALHKISQNAADHRTAATATAMTLCDATAGSMASCTAESLARLIEAVAAWQLHPGMYLHNVQ